MMSSDDCPKVSIIMAAYNEENTIVDSIESIIKQTYKNFELIVVDDGSMDSTPEIVRDIQNEKIKLLQNSENESLPYSLNRGIRESDGQYIARHDADEISKPTRLERQVEYLDNNPDVQVVGCWCEIVGQNGEHIINEQISADRDFGVDDLVRNGPGLTHGSVMMRREALETLDGYREEFKYAQDYDLWLRVADEFGKGAIDYIPEVLYERRIEAGQIANRKPTLICAEYARKSANSNNDNGLLDEMCEKIDQTPARSLSEATEHAMYYYLIGMRYFRQGKRAEFYKNMFRSIATQPFLIRPWYQIGLSFLPENTRNKLRQYIRGSLYGS
jgi:glycosyltransferase involved in cell wall biosynthesis